MLLCLHLLLGALTATLIWCSGRQITRLFSRSRSGTLSTIAAFTYAFTPLVWEYSTTAEVFALNNFICAVLVYLCCATFTQLAMYGKVGDIVVRSRLYFLTGLGGLFCGLALSNQHSSLLLVAVVVPTILVSVGIYAKSLLVSVFIYSAGGFLLGFSSYLYLPWAAQQPTTGSWGELVSVEGFMRHVLRAEYGTFRLGMIVGSETAIERIWIYMKHTSEESGHLVFSILLLSLLLSVYQYWMSKNNTTHAVGKVLTPIKVKQKNLQLQKKVAKSNKDTTTSTGTTTKMVDITFSTTNETSELIRTKFGYLNFQCIAGLWSFYVIIWHCVLSNLPLSAPMPFAVHSRFWMQPNILLYTLMCVSLDSLWEYITIICKISTQSTIFRRVLEWSVVCTYIGIVLQSRYYSMDKSTAGNVMHSYGSALLESIMPPITTTPTTIPLQSLLLSHTDLDWNPVRYLQHCEGIGLPMKRLFSKSPLRRFAPLSQSTRSNTTVTHLSFQLMPYPWFPKSQAALYPHVKFPDMNFPGVSTDRNSEGNAQLILRFLYANNLHNISYKIQNNIIISKHNIFTTGTYIDMQSIQEAEIEPMGRWRGLTLIPWGTVYRIFGPLTTIQIQELHYYSLLQLYALQHKFPTINNAYIIKFQSGSWERAAANVYYDAHYQFGLHLLTFCIELQTKPELKLLPILLDRYYLSATILYKTLQNVQKYDTFSSSMLDLTKNTALAWMRLKALLEVTNKFRTEIIGIISNYPKTSQVCFDFKPFYCTYTVQYIYNVSLFCMGLITYLCF